MSVEYCIEIDDETDAALEQIRSEKVKQKIVQTLERLAEREDRIQQEQQELHERMGVNPSSDSEDLSDAELKREIQRFLRGDRQNDPRLGD